MTATRRRIYLMRHGAVSYFTANGTPLPPDDVALNDTGIAQATAAGVLFRQYAVSFDRIITSGLPRTLQTAKWVMHALGCQREIESRPQLGEIRGGKLSAIPVEKLRQSFTEIMDGSATLQTRFLGGETLGAMLDRVLPEIDKIRADENWSSLLLVCHGGVNRGILSYLLSGGKQLLGGFEQNPACINVIDVGQLQRDVVLRAINLSPTDWLQHSNRTTTMETLFGEYVQHRIKHR